MRRSPLLLFATTILSSMLPGPSGHLCFFVLAAEGSAENSADELRAESAHFVVASYRGGPSAWDVASRCETIWTRLRRDCLGRAEAMAWQPKCQVVLHSNLNSYRQATGQASAQTVGSSVIDVRAGRVSRRRIDLLVANTDQALAALPHEMTHVLLADVFPTSPPPRWAEEGLALLSDPADKRARHARDLRRALQTNTTLPLTRFFSDTEYPSAGDRGVFYAESMSLADYLVALDSPQRFVEFMELSQQVGQVPALQRVYDIRGLDELEGRWLRFAARQNVAPEGAAIGQTKSFRTQ